MTTTSHNPYLGTLGKAELKALLRVHKENPDKQKQIIEAIAALTPYRAGRLDANQMSALGRIMNAVPSPAALVEPGALSADDLAIVKAAIAQFLGPAKTETPASPPASLAA